MTFTLKHAFVSAKSDGVDTSFVQPSNWNASHVISFTGDGVVLGRALGAGAGVAQEINITDIGFQPGFVNDYAGSAAPAGWFLCYGQAVNRTTYAALFAVIGTTYGVGDGSTTFNLPDLRDRVTIGKGDMGGVAAGRITGAILPNTPILGTVGGAQTSTGTVSGTATGTVAGSTGGPGASIVAVQNASPDINVASNSHNHDFSVAASLAVSGTTGNITVLQPLMILNKIIKT